MRTAVLVLASDRGGFDGPKYLVPVSGEPLLQRVLEDVAEWPVDQVVVVLGADAEEVLAGLPPGTDTTFVVDEEWREGDAAALRVGLDVLWRTGCDRIVVARGDQPGIPADVVETLLARQERAGALAVVPKWRYARDWPVVLAEPLWSRLLGVEGHVDLVELLASHDEGVEEVWLDRLAPRRIRGPMDLPAAQR